MFPKIDYQVSMKCVQPRCEEVFGKTKDLINHFRAEHNQTLKCPHCEKKVKYGAGLIHHVRIHTGERPYFCPVQGCTFRSATKNNLKVHLSGKLHGWDVLMQFAHIFDRPKKKRHYSDLPDIIVKRQKTQMKGMQPMMSQMGMGMNGMMGMPPHMSQFGGPPGAGKMPTGMSPRGPGIPPEIGQLQIPTVKESSLLPDVKKVMEGLNLQIDTSLMPPISDIAKLAQASMNPSAISSILSASPTAPNLADFKDEKTAIVSNSVDMKIDI